jgi:hypothetical protein
MNKDHSAYSALSFDDRVQELCKAIVRMLEAISAMEEVTR